MTTLQQEQLDPRNFFRVLMKKSVLIVGLTAFGALAGWGVSQVKSPDWKVTAKFVAPRVTDLGSYFERFSTYQALNGGSATGYTLGSDGKGGFELTPEVSQDGETIAREGVFGEFLLQLVSADGLTDFLSHHPLVAEMAKAENEPLGAMVEKLIPHFASQSPTKSMPYSNMSLTLKDPELALRLLSDYVAFTNDRARASVLHELDKKWTVLHQFVETASQQKLGATQFGAQIATQDWSGKLAVMNQTPAAGNDMMTYRYVQQPRLPHVPASPNKMLWETIGAVLGLLLSSLIALFSTVRNRHA